MTSLLRDLPYPERLEEVLASKLEGVLKDRAPLGPCTFTGPDLRSARLALGLTALEAADVLGCHPNTIYNTELGISIPREAKVRRAMAWFIEEANRRLQA